MNGANFDMVIVHQCLHDLRRHNWNGGSSWNCADGLINFFGQAQVCPSTLAILGLKLTRSF